MLPMTYDVAFWDNFLSTGKDVDGNITLGSDGLPQLVVYPSNKSTGNFGELSLNDSHNGSSEIRGWIQNGIAQADVNDLTSSGLIPLSSHNANSWDWNGNPGFRSSVVQEVNDRSGQTFILPLFKAYNSSTDDYQAGTGNGSHYDYNIVRFVGVKIVSDPSDNRQVVIQPAAVTDSDMIFSSLNPVGSGGSGVVTTFGVSKLTR